MMKNTCTSLLSKVACRSLFLIVLISAISNKSISQYYTSFVDPFIGSGNHGHVFVGASVPFGAVQVGPDNFYKGWDWCSGYNYGDSVIRGFAQTHLNGTGIGDLSDIVIMPYTGDIKTDKGIETVRGSGYASKFSHQSEKVKPGYYSVKLSDYNVEVELTATERVGCHHYHFPTGKQAIIIIDLKEGINDASTDTYIKLVNDHTIEGYRFSKGWAKNQWIFFSIVSSKAIPVFRIYNGNNFIKADSGKGNAIKGIIVFDKSPEEIQLKVGISPVSCANAFNNIQSEVPDWNFKTVAKRADDKWNKELSKIDIQTKNLKDKKIFYTALYHSMIDPVLFNDHNKDYRGADKKVYSNASFNNYSVFSLWDTYRAVHPLYTIIEPDKVNDMVRTMLAIYNQQGKLPIWHLMGNETGTMVGISSLQVIAEAYLKGIRNYNVDSVYAAIKATACSDSLGLMYVKNFKFIPRELQARSVAKALEYCVADGSIALLAKSLGKTDDYKYFLKRSENYKLYYDSLNGFFRGRQADGNWNPVFNPVKSYKPWANDYAEGNAWQYLWLTPHDLNGLISLMGGKQRFTERLDFFFSLKQEDDPEALADLTGLIGQYAHGNEPSHHIAYFYTMIGQPWKTAEKIRFILNNFYSDKPEGIIGNEDCGQMSAWYIFSSMGFYPVFPASCKYVFGSPLFDKVTIHLPNGKLLQIKAENNSAKNIYIQSISLNGKKYSKNYIEHSDIINGGVITFKMDSQPAK